MKLKYLSVFILLIVISFTSCPPELEEAPSGIEYMIENVPLTFENWLEILEKIDEKNSFINLDLSNCTAGAPGDSAFFEDTYSSKTFIIFNALPYLSTDLGIDDEVREMIKSAKRKIVSITLPKTATMIDNGDQNASTFKDFTYLRSITGEAVENIGDYAFLGLQHLREVNFPFLGNNLTSASIGKFAFAGCTSLTSINFPYVKIIDTNAFENTGLVNIKLMDLPMVENIGNYTFRGCNKLKSVNFSYAINIGEEAFANCVSLETARFTANPDAPAPDNRIIFNDRAFVGSKSLKSLEIPNAYKVEFKVDALANIGNHLDLELYDDIDESKCSGHPQTELFLGGGTYPRTLNSIKFILPRLDDVDESVIRDEIYKYIETKYEGALTVTIIRK